MSLIPNKIIQGDCLQVMSNFPDACIDSIVTDPPYGINFLQKDWDHGIPGAAYWAESLRVAKPGTHILAFGGTRTYHRLICAIEDAGWEIRDCLNWLYGSGFPKSHYLLKPAWEPIVLAKKKGKGFINIDGCRIGFVSDADRAESVNKNQHSKYKNPHSNKDSYSGDYPPRYNYDGSKGRWPANLLLDEESASILGKHSRFFYIAKASARERGEDNNHPTVKPILLMEYLCKLITPPGGIVLDPFAGSGSTLIAARNLGFNYLGIEKDAESVASAERRITKGHISLDNFTKEKVIA